MKIAARARISLAAIVAASKRIISKPRFLSTARKRPQDFTRNRKLPFDKLVVFMINMVKSSTQVCLDNFFEMTGDGDMHMTQQSFSDARQKINWEAFRLLFREIVDKIYTGYYATWHGYRISAIDGSKMQLPDDAKLRGHFGTVGQGNTAATAQASALYDVYNNILVDVQLAPISTGERKLALQHIEELRKMPSFAKECILFDRGYASFELIKTLADCGISFVMRVKKGFNVPIDQLGQGDHSALLQKAGQKDINVRVVKFALPSGEEETLITDIMDKRMGAGAFKALYFKRWPIETKYDEIKNKLEVENFSGRTINAIMQDFFITMYMSNVVAVACWEAQSVVDQAQKYKDNKYNYHVNMNQAIGTLKDRFIMAMLESDPQVRSDKVQRILFLLTENIVPTRPGRSIPRNNSPRKAKFRHNRKSNC